MLVYESKLEGTSEQYRRIDESIRTALFVRNACIRLWMDGGAKSRNDLYKHCKALSDNPQLPWAKLLNSQARQASAERAWAAIARFFDNCKNIAKGKKGFPKFKKNRINHGSVEYKQTGYKLSEDRKYINFTDGFSSGLFKLWGTRDLHYYQLSQIKRVRIVRRADGYYAQFLIDYERVEKRSPSYKTVGLDVGLSFFLTDSEGNQIENPRHLRKSEKSLKRLHRRFSKTQLGSKNRALFRNKLARAHLKVSRQRKDFAVKTARCVIQSNDLVAYEDLKVRNMIRNRRTTKSISDAAWTQFRQWIEYFGKVFGVVTVAVPPHNTSQKCSLCGEIVKKSLSTRTHNCPHCGHIQDRDWNAARNILSIGLRTVGHTGTLIASGETDQYLGEVTPPSKSTRGKRKSKK